MYPTNKKMYPEICHFITVIFQKYIFVMKYLSLMSITLDIMGVLTEFVRKTLLWTITRFNFIFYVGHICLFIVSL